MKTLNKNSCFLDISKRIALRSCSKTLRKRLFFQLAKCLPRVVILKYNFYVLDFFKEFARNSIKYLKPDIIVVKLCIDIAFLGTSKKTLFIKKRRMQNKNKLG